nr:MAG TPA: hypothetical protein [Caudoviricetes sp.]
MNKELLFILNQINRRPYMYECMSALFKAHGLCKPSTFCTNCLLNKNPSPNLYKNQILRMKV